MLAHQREVNLIAQTKNSPLSGAVISITLNGCQNSMEVIERTSKSSNYYEKINHVWHNLPP